MTSILLALPSKGRLHDQMNKFFESSGIILKRSGGQRTYSGFIKDIEEIDYYKKGLINNIYSFASNIIFRVNIVVESIKVIKFATITGIEWISQP